MNTRLLKKQYEVSREGMIKIYPSLPGTKEKSRLVEVLKKLMQIRKEN
jgi:hypothetical protein